MSAWLCLTISPRLARSGRAGSCNGNTIYYYQDWGLSPLELSSQFRSLLVVTWATDTSRVKLRVLWFADWMTAMLLLLVVLFGCSVAFRTPMGGARIRWAEMHLLLLTAGRPHAQEATASLAWTCRIPTLVPRCGGACTRRALQVCHYRRLARRLPAAAGG